MGEKKNNKTVPLSVGHHFEERFQGFLAKERSQEVRSLKEALYQWWLRWEEVDTGVEDLRHQSVASWADYVEYSREGEEGDPVMVGGFTSLVRWMEERLEGRVEVRLESRVERVAWAGEEGVVVTCHTGVKHSGRLAICALPLGVLKQEHTQMFQPALPRKKVEVIEKLGFGTMDKIFLKFDSVFWDEDNPGIQLVDTTRKMNCEEDDLAETWQDNIAGFDVVVGQENTLCGWVVGRTARYMETLTTQQVEPHFSKW